MAGSDVVESKSMLVMAPGSGAFSAVLHRLAAERAEADGMLQDALAPIFQDGSRDRQHEDTILDEEMPASGKRHRRRHVLAARLE
jgi:hypothetical protein